MRWDRFFEDLEDQLTSEWEAERAALDSEAERLRLSRVTLRERLLSLVARDPVAPAPSFEVRGGGSLAGEVVRVGADWVALAPSRAATAIIPFGALDHITLSHADILRSARPADTSSSLSERMTLGFVLRDLSRKRAAVVVRLVDGHTLTGTIDRAGVDHCDLALHDPGAPRRTSDVSGYRLVPFGAIGWVRADDPAAR